MELSTASRQSCVSPSNSALTSADFASSRFLTTASTCWVTAPTAANRSINESSMLPRSLAGVPRSSSQCLNLRDGLEITANASRNAANSPSPPPASGCTSLPATRKASRNDFSENASPGSTPNFSNALIIAALVENQRRADKTRCGPALSHLAHPASAATFLSHDRGASRP